MAWLFVLLGYLLGSVPTAYIAGYLTRNVDIRQVGDANVGAANAYRELGHKTGIAVGLFDAGKGILAILIAQTASLSQFAILTAGLAAVIGHNWPVFIGFRGGRGVSTTIGIFLAVLTKPVLIAAGPAVLALLLRKNVTMACALLFVPLPLVSWWLGAPGMLVSYSIALPGLAGVTHYLRVRRKLPRHAT